MWIGSQIQSSASLGAALAVTMTGVVATILLGVIVLAAAWVLTLFLAAYPAIVRLDGQAGIQRSLWTSIAVAIGILPVAGAIYVASSV
jgi:hypothetical protein